MKSLRFSALAALLGLLAATASAMAAPGSATTNVNVRSGPGPLYPVIDMLRAGEPMDIQNCSAGWCQITSALSSGWVSQNYVTYNVGPQRPQRPQPPVVRPSPQQPSWPGRPYPGPGNNGSFPGQGNSYPWPGQQNPWPRPVPPPVVEQDAAACFYSSPNFRGDSFCIDEGETLNRLGRDWDRRIRSVEVFGGNQVDLCSDRNLYGSCVTLRSNASRLPGNIDGRAASLEAY